MEEKRRSLFLLKRNNQIKNFFRRDFWSSRFGEVAVYVPPFRVALGLLLDYVEKGLKKMKPARTPLEETKPEFFKRKGMENENAQKMVLFGDVLWREWLGGEGEGMEGKEKKVR